MASAEWGMCRLWMCTGLGYGYEGMVDTYLQCQAGRFDVGLVAHLASGVTGVLGLKWCDDVGGDMRERSQRGMGG